MTDANYRDVLWAFSLDSNADTRRAIVRVFSREQDIYETQSGPFEGFPVDLPLRQRSGSSDAPPRSTQASPVPGDLWAHGQRLFAAMPPHATVPLRTATPDQPVRLKIASNSAAIDDLVWEWLNDGQDPCLALRPNIRLSRVVPIHLAVPPLTVAPPVRVLLVLTNPKDERLLDPWREIAAVRSGLSSPFYSVEQLAEPTWDALVEALRREPWHIVHYIGHAGVDRGQGNIILHDDSERTHWIGGSDLGAVLPMTVRLLCLSTCYTAPNYQIAGLPRLAHTIASGRLPTVIANQYPVGEGGVRGFWQAFYAGLLEYRGNMNEAFHDAQAACASTGGPDWGSFSMVIRDQSGQALRFDATSSTVAGRNDEEIQAQFLTQFANDLSTRVLTYGAAAPSSVVEQFDEVASTAMSMTENLRRTE